MTKVCTGCNRLLPAEAFYRSKSASDGLTSRCRECTKAQVNAYRLANRETVLARKKAYRETHQDVIRAGKRRHYEAHREELIAKSRAYVLANPERTAAQKKDWLRRNPDKDRQRKQRRRDRIANAPISDFTEQQWGDLLIYFNHCCAFCGQPSEALEAEHMQPLFRGGSHTAENIVPACPGCNKRKSTRTLLEWVRVGGGLRP